MDADHQHDPPPPEHALAAQVPGPLVIMMPFELESREVAHAAADRAAAEQARRTQQ